MIVPKALAMLALAVLAAACTVTTGCGDAASQAAGNRPAGNKASASNAPKEQPKEQPKEEPKGDPDLPKGEVTDDGLTFKVGYERGDGFARLSRQNDMLRVDVDVRLPYSAGDGQSSSGSALDLVLSVDGLHGRHLFFYPNRLWVPSRDGNLAAFRLEMSWDREKDQPARLAGEPSFVGQSNVRFWDHWTATMWVDLRYVLVPGNSPTSMADSWLFGVVTGNEAATAIFPAGMDIANPGKTPKKLVEFTYSKLPVVEAEEDSPRDTLTETEAANHEHMRGVQARLTVRDLKGAMTKATEAIKEDPDRLWAHNLAYLISYTASLQKIDGVDLDYIKFQRAYIDAAPGQSSAHLDYLRNLLPLDRFDDAAAHAKTIFDSAMCKGRAATDGYMRLKWAEQCINWGLLDEVKKQFEHIDSKPDLVKEDNFRVDYNFQKAAVAVRQGDSAKAIEIYEALLKNERNFLNRDQFNLVQQTLQFQRQAADQWEEELTFQAEDAKKTNPRLVVETSKGKIVIELFEDDAPNTTASLVSLASKKFYDGLNFHRVEPNFVAQGGCPKGTGEGTPGYRLKDEVGRRNHFRGTVAMARTMQPHTQGSQFYICVSNGNNVLNLSGNYTTVGRVIEGMDVADRLRVGDKIVSIRAENLREHEYKPETLKE